MDISCPHGQQRCGRLVVWISGRRQIIRPLPALYCMCEYAGELLWQCGAPGKKPGSEERYYHAFPVLTIRDMVRMYQILRSFLGIEQIHIGIGGSMGGQQLLNGPLMNQQRLNTLYPLLPMPGIRPGARHSMLPSVGVLKPILPGNKVCRKQA